MGNVRHELNEISAEMKRSYDRERRLLSFDEYLDVFQENPGRQLRDAATYLRDMIDHYGTVSVPRPWGKETRYRVFDREFLADDEERREALVGQEEVQDELHRALGNFVQEGRANRVILLHGPNGSAKSTIAACLMRGLEDYSTRTEGALYRYNWVFPKKASVRGTIGFGGERPTSERPLSYAHLPDEELEARVIVEVRDHPLFLVPLEQRQRLFEATLRQAGVKVSPGSTSGTARLPRWLTHGTLCHKSQQIFSALLASYGGNLAEVLRHVQVERYFVSRRYRVGAVTLGPELSVDARERQVTADRNLGSLPTSLQGLSLYEVAGELVDAAGGLLELSDLLKRPIDAFKYLQMTAETGEVALASQSLLVNTVLLASGNELHLTAFRQHSEFESFRGRLDLVRVPYLRSYMDERTIYDRQIASGVRTHVAPHATALAARFAVLSRLRRPDPNRVAPNFKEAISKLSAWDKMQLFAGREAQTDTDDVSFELWPLVQELFHEWDTVVDYEASFGASPREMRALLLDAAQHPQFAYLSPFAVLDELDELCERVNDYAFLRLEAQPGGFHDHADFRRRLRHWLFDVIEDEFRQASGIVEEGRYDELLGRYIEHVSASVKGEKMRNSTTGDHEPPDERLMADVERLLGASGDAAAFRAGLLRRIAAFALEHPGVPVREGEVFRDALARIRKSVFEEKKVVLARFCRQLAEEPESLKPPDKERIERALAVLATRFGYMEQSARDAAGRLLSERYSQL
ncbi:MAG TPA: serine protein kinase PrkA [Polyangiaceae bacterium]|nr:serine protein kinase PrkA [Polyangiaceae bacterium]